MKKLKLLLLPVIFAAGLFVGEFVGMYDVIPDQLGGLTTSLSYTNSVSNVATVSSSILSANTSRQYAKCIRRDSVSQLDTIFVTFGSTASKNWGFPISASGSFEITHNNMGEIYVGAVKGVIESETGSTSAGYGRFNCIEQ